MTRALRPDGITWPVDSEGKPTNRLELLSSQNGLEHTKAHDALSDVEALISVTRLIKQHQPQLYEYLLKMRDKNEIKKLVNLDQKQPFVYVSGRLDGEFNKATVAFPLTAGKNGTVVVYDLRYDPTPFIGLSAKDIAKKFYASWEERQADDFVKLPVKELQYNRAPAVAPLGVLEQSDGWTKIGLTQEVITKHRDILMSAPGFAETLRELFEAKKDYQKSNDPEAQLYDSFVPDIDKLRIETVRNADERTLADFHPAFNDERLPGLLLHYKARNYPKSLAEDEVPLWEAWRSERIRTALPGFVKSLQRLSATVSDDSKQFVLQELQLWAESIVPIDDGEGDG